MTSLQLSLWIFFVVAIQLAALLCYQLYRHWLGYRQLQRQLGRWQGEQERPGLPAAAPAWAGERELVVTAREQEDAAGTICSFYLQAENGAALPPFLPGQYLTFKLFAGGTEAPAIVRCYSLSMAPASDSYRISVKRQDAPVDQPTVPPGLSSHYLHQQIRPGDRLLVRAPAGHFYLPADLEAPLVLVAGGIGITPLLSMVEVSLRQRPERELWLFYGVRNGAACAFGERLQALAQQYTHFHLRRCFSRPQAGEQLGRDYEVAGHADIELLRQSLPLQPFHYFVCGSAAMMESLVPALRDWQVPESHIHYESFGPASVAAVPKQALSAPLTVSFAESGQQLSWDGQQASLLALAEQHGIEIDYGCRAGSCGCCQTKLTAGEVEYQQAPDFDPDPGCCLLCIASPKTDITLSA